MQEIRTGPRPGVSFDAEPAGLIAHDAVACSVTRIDATVFYSFGLGKDEVKRNRLSVNIQNLSNRKYYEWGGRTRLCFRPHRST